MVKFIQKIHHSMQSLTNGKLPCTFAPAKSANWYCKVFWPKTSVHINLKTRTKSVLLELELLYQSLFFSFSKIILIV